MVPSREIQYSGPSRTLLRSRMNSWFNDTGARAVAVAFQSVFRAEIH